jgi:hypothetical protein
VLAASIIRTIALMMEAVSTSETSVNFYHTTRRNNPDNSQLHTRRRENLKSHFFPDLLLGLVLNWNTQQCSYISVPKLLVIED